MPREAAEEMIDMGSGGARFRSGPAPDPLALRRSRSSDAEWTTLAAEGRAGDPPVWPLTQMSEREEQLWAALWRRPQATQWEELGQTDEVALYCRRFAEAEEPGSSVALTTLVRQLADALGLTIPGLRVNRWKIAPKKGSKQSSSDAEKSAVGPVSAPATGARGRFTVIQGDGEGA